MASLANFTNNLNELWKKAGGKGSSFVPTLAAAVEVTPRAIYKLLDGTEPSLELALKISKELGFSLESGERAEPVHKPAPEELKLLELMERFAIGEKRKRICRLALTAEPKLVDTMHDTSLEPYFKLVEGGAADNKKPAVR